MLKTADYSEIVWTYSLIVHFVFDFAGIFSETNWSPVVLILIVSSQKHC